MTWGWDPRKDVANQAKHGVSFRLARLVFDDPLHLSEPDPHQEEERRRTLGQVGGVCLFVVHTIWNDAEPSGRIISARRATPTERKAYEES